MNNYISECYAETATVTNAMKVRNALLASAIPCEIIKQASKNGKGCIYAVSFSCSQANNVSTILSNTKIQIKHLNIN